MSTPFFCDNCGAALMEVVSACTACGSAVGLVSQPVYQAQPAIFQPASTSLARVVTSAPVPPCTLPPGFLLARRYQIMEQLGQGGFATVYKARDRAQRHTLVAIKQIHLERLNLQEMLDASDAYNREVNHLSQLRYKHLPCIYAHFMDEQHWYIVIEYIAGQTLEEWLNTARRKAMPVMQVLDIGIDLCNTLQYLHMQRPPLIFRDVKPANVIITRSGKLYLIDFGTIRPYRPGWKDTGPLGTPGYAAPEQYGSRAHTTPQTDIYGLGATLQTLLAGREPLEILQHGFPPTFAMRVPPKLLDELARMQQRDATKRPCDMAEVRQALQAIKDQFLSQKLKAAVHAGWELWQETSVFATMSAILLVFLDFASFINMIWPGVWIVSLLAIVVFAVLGSFVRLRDARIENLGQLPLGEKVAIIWKQCAASLTFSLLVSLFSYYLFSWLSLFNTPPEDVGTDWVTSGVVVVVSLLIGLAWVLRQLFMMRARRRRISQQKQEILVQQTIRQRP